MVKFTLKKSKHWNFPGGPVVKNQPSNAGDEGSVPGRGTKIPHASGPLGPSTTDPKCNNERPYMMEQNPVCHS